MNHRWDTSGKDLRRVRVGETISYSSGKVPDGDIAQLVREARKSHAEAVTEGILQIPVGMLRVTQYVLPLCDTLEEREREVERLREALRKVLDENAQQAIQNEDNRA